MEFPLDHLKFCSNVVLLIDSLNLATTQYGRAAKELSLVMGILSESDYRIRRADVERARQDAEETRAPLLASTGTWMLS